MKIHQILICILLSTAAIWFFSVEYYAKGYSDARELYPAPRQSWISDYELGKIDGSAETFSHYYDTLVWCQKHPSCKLPSI